MIEATENTTRELAQSFLAPAGRSIFWTVFPDVYAKSMKPCSGSLSDLIKQLESAGSFPAKSACPLISLATYGPHQADKDCLRHDPNVLQVFGVVGDYDAGVVTLTEAVKVAESHGIRAIFYTSASHTPEKPRWRVVCPLSHPHDPGAHYSLVARLNGALGGVLAGESFTLSQSYYFGDTPGNECRVTVTFDDPEDGTCIDELDELDNIAIGKPTHPIVLEATPENPDPCGIALFDAKTKSLGRKLKTGDGRRDLLKSFIASRSARGVKGDDLRLLVDGVVARYFDPADPPGRKDIEELPKWAHDRDEKRRQEGAALAASLLAGGAEFSLDQFALNGQSQEMRAKMLEDVHILGRLALLGQLTAFYTERNGGKTLLTLWMLTDAIKRGTINPADAFYINSDDTHKGLVEKTEIAERHGFKMLADGYKKFKNSMLVEHLGTLVRSEQARGKIIILDTLKKFTDVMNKRESSDFMTALRSFAMQGGSVIMLAHVNKHRDENGKLVFSGTADVVDDADCAYLMDKVVRDGRTIVTFDNFKARGDVAEKAVYSFERNPDGGQTYAQLLDTVQPVGEEELQRAREAARVATQVGENAKIIASVLDAIGEGVTKRTELIEAVHASTGESKRRVIHALDAHTGADFLAGARWQIVKGDKNAKVYQALPLFSSFSGKEGGV